MMQLSENAAAALETIRQSQGIPEEAGTRLTAEEEEAGGLALKLEFVGEVPETDETVEQSGTEIHLDPKVVEPLENTLMDIQDGEEGMTFVFKSQSE